MRMRSERTLHAECNTYIITIHMNYSLFDCDRFQVLRPLDNFSIWKLPIYVFFSIKSKSFQYKANSFSSNGRLFAKTLGISPLSALSKNFFNGNDKSDRITKYVVVARLLGKERSCLRKLSENS